MLSGTAAELLARCWFPPPGEDLACAVSGGRDSLALLALGVAAGCKVTAYHVDHGLRAGSEKEADVVAEAAAGLGAGFISLKVSCPPGPNLEARARAARFAVLPGGVATGHTADDQAETILLNLLRGAGLDGLSGMSFDRRHPLLRLRRAETRELVEGLGIRTVEDPTNADARFVRNRVRHELFPLICSIAGRDLVPILARQGELLADEARLLDELAAEIEVADVAALRAAPVALRRRALRAWLRASQAERYPPDASAIGRVLAVVAGTVRACELPGGRRLSRSGGRLVVRP